MTPVAARRDVRVVPLTGKTALVTGASRGLGRAIALELATLGATVVVTARTDVARNDIAGTIGETAAAIESRGGRGRTIKADLLVADDLERLVKETLDGFGRLDVLVNNAAFIGEDVFQSVWEMSVAGWQNQLALNVNVPFALTKAFSPAMRRMGGGLVVNLSSIAALPAPPGPLPLPGAGGLGAAYPTSKAALNQMTAYLGNELREFGITVVALDPGFARSESAELLAARMGIDPALAQPVTVAAKAVGFLATSPDRLDYAGQFVVARELLERHGLPVD